MKKTFFREATKAEIKKKNLIDVSELSNILNLKDTEYVILDANKLVPRGYENARKFMKHGNEVKLKRVYSLEQAIMLGKTPVQLREQAFNSIDNPFYCGYTFMPLGRDRRKRKVSLIECLEGARIFAYSNQVGTEIKIKAYADAKRVRREGAEIVGEVPSREKDERRIQLKLMSVPFVDSPEKYVLAYNIGSDHSCSSKRFNIRYKYSDDKEGSGIINICAHEIAAYLQLIQQEWKQKKNIIPLQMCQFAIPTQETVNYYLRWGNNILIRDNSLKAKDKLRKPNRGEKEIGLWELVRNLKHDETFYSRDSRDGSVANYKWV